MVDTGTNITSAMGEPDMVWDVDDVPQDECGVFGIWAPGQVVSKVTYFGLYALQHRGQESAGIAVADHGRIMVFKDMGLVSRVFDESTLSSLTGSSAIGHTRYSTAGASTWANAQPTFGSAPWGDMALAHNGNLTNTPDLQEWLSMIAPGHKTPEKNVMDSTTDTSIVAGLLAALPGPCDEAITTVLPRLDGAFSLVILTAQSLWAARDRHGMRPLCLGSLDDGWVIASETAALDIVGATLIREIDPGEAIRIDATGITSTRFAEPDPRVCLFEYVYLSRPDSMVDDRLIHNVRVKIGKLLAHECPVEADLVIPVPDSGTPAAIGFAAGSGIPYGSGLVKNAYVGRTFIQPSQHLRQLGIRLKLNPLKKVVEGKRIVVVDDSIVRGNTQRQVVAMLRAAGAREVHVRISSPPVKWPCFFGIDFADPHELIASKLNVDQMAQSIGADSLGYISLDALIAATHRPADSLCRACFDGQYTVPVPCDKTKQLGLADDGLGQASYIGSGASQPTDDMKESKE